MSQSTAEKQEPLHLLSLPSELLEAIWTVIQEADDREQKSPWFSRPRDPFANIRLTCRRIHRSVRACEPNYITTYNRFPQLMERFTANKRLNYGVAVQKYRSVSIEIDLQASWLTFFLLSTFLEEAECLEELRLYFFGRDAFGTRVFVHDCGKAPFMGREQKLPREGQRSPHQMIPILKAIRSLERLRILVVNNMNSQLFPAVFKDKPRLQYVHVVSDPRSALHTEYNINDLGPLIAPLNEYFPPIKAAHMSANSTLGGFALLSNCARTLKHLTWTVPASSFDSNNVINNNFFNNTSQLFANLKLKGCELEILRICIADAGMYESQSIVVGNLQLSLTHIFQGFTQLRHFELHAEVGTYFSIRLVEGLPSGLSRLYASENLIGVENLHKLITQKYLYAEHHVQSSRARKFQEHKNDFESDREEESSLCSDIVHNNFPASQDNITFWINPLSYEPRFYDDASAPIGNLVIREGEKRNGRALFLDGIIGETVERRTDYIPLFGDLGFVAYEFKTKSASRRALKTGETAKQMILRLNGRLLDRERNFHLRNHRRGSPSRSRQVGKEGLTAARAETATSSEYMGIRILLHGLYEVEAVQPRRIEAAMAELAESQFSESMDWYFGQENAAREIFEREPVASPDSLPPYRYPAVVDDVGSADGHCHWLCPEADVIPFGTWNDMKARYRACKKKEQQSAERNGAASS